MGLFSDEPDRQRVTDRQTETETQRETERERDGIIFR